MANEILWSAKSEATLLSTELNNMAKDTFVIDAADYDNATNKYTDADFLFFADDWDAAPTAGGYVELHLFYKYDGANYADNGPGDADSNAKPDYNTLVGRAPVQAVDGDQYIPFRDVELKPYAFRACLYLRETDQDLTAVDTHFLKIYPHVREVQ